MRKRPRQGLCFIICFFFSFSILLYAVTVYRENFYDNLVQSWQLPEEMRREGVDKVREYERQRLKAFHTGTPLDEIFHDPVMVEYVAETHANAAKYEHDFRFDLVPRICKREPSVFPLTFFHIYGKLCSFENLQHATLMGFVSAYGMGPYADSDSAFNDMGEAIYAWECEGNIREGEWLDAFMASPEYEAFLQDLYAEIESSEGKSLEDMVEEIREAPTESHNPLSELKTPFLKDAQKLANTVYESYQKDKEQGNISRITLEAKILQELYDRVLWIEALTPYQCMNLRWITSFLPDPLVDLAAIFVCSLVISLAATYIVSTKYWK